MLANPYTLAEFNAWANRHLYSACAQLTAQELSKNRRAFFKSIIGTLNHILLVDILYRDRLEGRPAIFKTLNEILYSDIDSLSAHQFSEDKNWLRLTKELDVNSMNETIRFWTLLDEPDLWEVPKHIYFTNLSQHQIHHRGQTHNMLSHAGVIAPPIGYIEFRIETDGSFITTPGD